jgi:hypothetical protein
MRLYLSALSLLIATSAGPAQDKPKEKPKGLPRIAIDDPANLKDDKDFAVQGEYVGSLTIDGKGIKLGLQVIADGGGKFTVKSFVGGLPGDGWEGKPSGDRMMGEFEEQKMIVRNDEKYVIGEIKDRVLTVTGAARMPAKGSLKKVDRKSPTLGVEPSKGAVVLFAKEGDEKNWSGGKLVELSDGKFLNNGIKSKQSFGNFTLHVEFRLPWMPNSRGQGRANSGVYLQDRYEIQVLDSFGLKGLTNECGGIYQQHAPKVNMCYPPMVWQTYDVEFTAAQFDGGKKVKPARATIKHNGVLIHDDVEMKGPTGGGQPETDKPGPIQLQNHGDPVAYRNIWVVEKK